MDLSLSVSNSANAFLNVLGFNKSANAGLAAVSLEVTLVDNKSLDNLLFVIESFPITSQIVLLNAAFPSSVIGALFVEAVSPSSAETRTPNSIKSVYTFNMCVDTGPPSTQRSFW